SRSHAPSSRRSRSSPDARAPRAATAPAPVRTARSTPRRAGDGNARSSPDQDKHRRRSPAPRRPPGSAARSHARNALQSRTPTSATPPSTPGRTPAARSRHPDTRRAAPKDRDARQPRPPPTPNDRTEATPAHPASAETPAPTTRPQTVEHSPPQPPKPPARTRVTRHAPRLFQLVDQAAERMVDEVERAREFAAELGAAVEVAAARGLLRDADRLEVHPEDR